MAVGRLRSAPGSPLRIVLVLVVLLVAVVGGGFALGILGAPAVQGVDNTFGNVTAETTVIHTDIGIRNPNPIGIDLGDVSVNYTVEMNGVEMASGAKDGLSLPTGNSTLALETAMRNDAIPAWWRSHVDNGERTTVLIDATVCSGLLGRSAPISRTKEIQTDILSAFNSDEPRPVNANHALVDDPILYVNETTAEWGAVSESATPIEMAFDVYNPNLQPYAITEVRYNITMNEVHVGTGETHQEHVIPSYGTETIPLTTAIQVDQLDEWWVSHLDEAVHGHQVSVLRIEFAAVVELPSGETITIPLDQLTYEERIETDVFDEGLHGSSPSDGTDEGETPTGNGDTPTPTETELLSGGTPTVSNATPTLSPVGTTVLPGETASPTATATPTSNETPTATETSDGGGLLG